MIRVLTYSSVRPTYTNGSFADGVGDVANAEGGEVQKCFNCGEPGYVP